MRTFIWLLIIAVLVIIGVMIAKRPSSVTTPPSTQAATTQSVTDQQPGTAASSTPAPKTSAAAPITTITTTKDGMKIQTITEGTGPAITTGQTASVQYEGKLADGSVFDSTAKHGGQPFSFQLGAGMVIKGWEEGVLGMKVGETRMLTIPPELAYGPQGYPPIIPQNATLTFTVTLEGIK